ncbi:MAG TPA: hypothetical protein VMM18_16620 [Gemmatimonadaceae bacterium]|nr:hypothetical protein [Gemmatimonadaceae bacterium]
MLDNLNAHGDGAEGSRERAHRTPETRPMADREVPLRRRTTPAAVHAWLDGELPETAVRRGEHARDVELWKQITREAESRRAVRTPAHVQAAIMSAIPQTAPQAISPWYRREFVISPLAALGAAMGLVALAAMVTAAILRLR